MSQWQPTSIHSNFLAVLPGGLLLCALLTGCYAEDDWATDRYGSMHHSQITFRDTPEFETAAEKVEPTEVCLRKVKFVDVEGKETRLDQYLGKKNVVLVVTRGHTRPICIYCTTQTSRMVAQYDEMARRGAEVVVVYPVKQKEETGELNAWLASVRRKLDVPVEKLPFPLWLDMELQAVDQLGIRQDLSKPATYILDKEGQLRYAYVGSTISDRPSVKAILAKLDEMNAETKKEP